MITHQSYELNSVCVQPSQYSVYVTLQGMNEYAALIKVICMQIKENLLVLSHYFSSNASVNNLH
jgi:hypothetical protein